MTLVIGPADGTQQKLGRGERVAADVGQRAAAGRVVPEGERSGGVRHVIFGVYAAVSPDFAEFAGGDHIAREAEHRVAEIVETDLRLHAGRLGGLGHFASVDGEGRQRLLAIDMLARSDRRQRHFLVQRVRRSDVHDIDIGIGDERAPVRGRARKPKGCGGLRGGLVVDVGEGVHLRLIGKVEDLRRGRVAESMRLAHEAAADEADAKLRFGHVRSPCSR